MPSHLTPGVYEPETLKIMVDAFDRAWKEFRHTPRNAEAKLVRNLMACAIIGALDAGAVESTILVDKALRAARAAILGDREAPARRNRADPQPRARVSAPASHLQSALDFAECV